MDIKIVGTGAVRPGLIDGFGHIIDIDINHRVDVRNSRLRIRGVEGVFFVDLG